MKRTFCEYQRCDKQWDDDEQEEIQVLRCNLFAEEGSWEEYCDCDEQEAKECMLYKYKKLKEELERSQKEKKIPEKLKLYTLSNNDSADFTTLQDFNNRVIQRTINWILDYLRSKGE